MPTSYTSSLFSIKPLVPYFEQGFTVLTVNARLARHIKSAWDEHQRAQGQRLWTQARVYALDHWLLQQWQRAVRQGLCDPSQLLNSWQQQEIWRGIILTRHSALLRSEQTLALAAQARDLLLRWQIDVRSPALRQQFELDGDCREYLQWHGEFQNQLDRASQVTAADALVALAASHGDEQQGDEKVVLFAIDTLPPLLADCLDRLCEQVLRIGQDARQAPRFQCAFDDPRAELAGVARWATALIKSDPQASLGIVLPDMTGDRPVLEYYLRQAFDCLGDDYSHLPVNFSAGITLAQTPVMSAALHCLRLHHQPLPLADIVALLQSRFVALDAVDGAETLALITALFKAGKSEYGSATLRNTATGLVLAQVLLSQSQRRELRQRHKPSDWVALWCEMLDEWGWPGTGTLDSLEYQQIQQWYRLLEDLAQADELVGELDYGDALALLHRVVSATPSQPKSPPARIHVMGMLEAEGLAFDHLWLCRLQGESWPAPARPNPFVPLALQRACHMPHASAEREWDYAQHLMRQYEQCSGTLYASYSTVMDGVAASPSALLEGFRPMSIAPVELLDTPTTTRMEQAHWEALDDWQAPPVSADELSQLRGGSGIVQTQSLCPMHAFVRYRLGVEPLADPIVGLGPLQQGNLLHSALYRLWGELGDSDALHRLTPDQRASTIAQAVNDTFAERPHAGAVGGRWYAIEQQRLCQLLEQWLTLEQSRDAFAVVQREQAVELNLSGLPIRLQIDRVDRLASGEQVIIDYKSGACDTRGWEGERPAQPQLPLYGMTTDTLPGAVSFASLHPQKMGFFGWGDVSGVTGIKAPKDLSWAEVNRYWHQQLELLAQEFLDGVADVDLCKGPCSHPLLCRGEKL